MSRSYVCVRPTLVVHLTVCRPRCSEVSPNPLKHARQSVQDCFQYYTRKSFAPKAPPAMHDVLTWRLSARCSRGALKLPNNIVPDGRLIIAGNQNVSLQSSQSSCAQLGHMRQEQFFGSRLHFDALYAGYSLESCLPVSAFVAASPEGLFTCESGCLVRGRCRGLACTGRGPLGGCAGRGGHHAAGEPRVMPDGEHEIPARQVSFRGRAASHASTNGR